MSNTEGSFIEKCVRGDALLEEIDEYVDSWHDSEGDDELADYLGMTSSEYEAWLHDNTVLAFVVKARKEGRSFKAVAKERHDLPLAARSGSQADQSAVLLWLNKTGRLND